MSVYEKNNRLNDKAIHSKIEHLKIQTAAVASDTLGLICHPLYAVFQRQV